MEAIAIILIVINLVGFFLMGIDKVKAKHGFRRIKESLLLGIALAFGAVGVYTGLRVFRHKSKHKSFTITLPVLIGVQAMVLLWLAQRF